MSPLTLSSHGQKPKPVWIFISSEASTTLERLNQVDLEKAVIWVPPAGLESTTTQTKTSLYFAKTGTAV